jgi:hypothetical protein
LRGDVAATIGPTTAGLRPTPFGSQPRIIAIAEFDAKYLQAEKARNALECSCQELESHLDAHGCDPNLK